MSGWEQASREYRPIVRCERCQALEEENEQLRKKLLASYERIAAQSELLTRKAEDR